MSRIKYHTPRRWVFSWLVLAMAWFPCAAPAFSAEFRAFEKTYVRQTGAPETETDTFGVLNPETAWMLRAVNGDLEDDTVERVSSSTLSLNETEVLEANDFNQNVGFIEVPVTVLSENTVATELWGRPGGQLYVEIVGQDNAPPTAVWLSPGEGQFLSAGLISAVLHLSDDIVGLDPMSLEIQLDGASVLGAFSPLTEPTLGATLLSDLALEEGFHILTAYVEDLAGQPVGDAVSFAVDQTSPQIIGLAPPDGTVLDNPRPTVSATFADAISGVDVSSIELTFDGVNVTAEATITNTSVSFTPATDLADGPYAAQLEVADRAGNLSTVETTFTVFTNYAPVLNPIGNQSVMEGEELSFLVTATDEDVEDNITLTATGLPEGAAFTDYGDRTGTFSWTPNFHFVGPTEGNRDILLTVEASDGQLTVSEEVIITVHNVTVPPPTVSLSVDQATVGVGVPFTLTVTGTSSYGLAAAWWFGQSTGVTDATVIMNYPSEPTSEEFFTAPVTNPTSLDRDFGSPLFSEAQAVTGYTFSSTVTVNQPGTYSFGADSRDALYPIAGEPHQASEGAGLATVTVTVTTGGTTIPGGNITQNTTWNLAGSPYIVQGDVFVLSGATLTIEAGVTVKFDGYYGLGALGVLDAQGTETNRITFTSAGDTPYRGDWSYIYLFGAESSSSQIAYWTVEYSDFGLILGDSSPPVTHVVASNCWLAFWIIDDSSPTITYSKAINNGNGIYVYRGAGTDPHPTVNRSSFYGNFYDVYIYTNTGGTFLDPNTTLNFEENWWGTVDTTEINASIWDHYDNQNVPYVDYLPFLDSEDGNPITPPGNLVEGLIEEDTTWHAADSPFIVINHVTVLSGVTLTIEPGVVVKFDGDYQIQVDGILNALGTELNPITFTSNQATPAMGDWSRIYLNDLESSSSQIAYWAIEYSSNGLYFNNSSPTVTRITASNNGAGFYITNGSDPTITDSEATDNGTGFSIRSGSSPTITYAKAIRNTYYGFSISRASGEDPHPTVNRSSFYDNGSLNVFVSGSFLDPNTTLNFQENWWGTTDTAQISASISDHQDFSSKPYVGYVPFLDSEDGNLAPGTSLGGLIAPNTTWSSAGNPFIVWQDVNVPSGDTLTIEPGVVVKFDSYYKIQVDGKLDAQGTALNPITFTSNKVNPSTEDWEWIYLNGPESSSSQIAYWTVEYSDLGLSFVNTSPAVTHVTASNNWTGFYIREGSSPTITYSKATYNSYGVYVHRPSGQDPHPTVNRSSFYGNSLYDVRLAGNFNDPNATLNFEENWWGTIDPAQIEAHILDHADDSAVPYVGFRPFLDSEDGEPIIEGAITQDTTWALADSPVIVSGNITVLSGVTLTIEPGVMVELDGHYQIQVDGTLNAQGTELDPITFTSNQATPAVGDWNRIYLNDLESSSSQIAYCMLEYCSSGLYFNDSSPTVTQVIVSNSGTGFYVYGSSSPTITYSKATDNTYGVTMSRFIFGPDPQPAVHRSSFYNNSSSNVSFDQGYSDPNITLDFEENWWGTANMDLIASTIIDHDDNATYPYVDYVPFLDGDDGELVFFIYEVTRSPEAMDHKRGGTVSISYSLSLDAYVTVKLYDELTGSPMRTLVDGEPRAEADQHVEVWDGSDDLAALLPYEAYYFDIYAETAEGRVAQYQAPLDGTPTATNATSENVNFDPYKNEQLLVHYTQPGPGRQVVCIRRLNPLSCIRTLSGNEPKSTGPKTETWNGRDDAGNIYAGPYDIYFDIPSPLHQNTIILESTLKAPADFSAEAYLILPAQSEVSTLSYTLDAEAEVTVTVRDPNGNHFRTLIEGEVQSPGEQALIWDSRNDQGEVAFLEGAYAVHVAAVDPLSGSSAEVVGNVTVYR